MGKASGYWSRNCIEDSLPDDGQENLVQTLLLPNSAASFLWEDLDPLKSLKYDIDEILYLFIQNLVLAYSSGLW
ncbi:unnamed protein product [Trifolium pratense]|uniref:Uncharacterized protein n=1 Tax=Trifolium pratense TaxID=57577 RepID=A0ACB0JKP3_TRIPR|nr:unnamed protein product [Trifolium pratense]